MENLDIQITIGELKQIVNDNIKEHVVKSLSKNKEQIEKSLDTFFEKKMFRNEDSQFEQALDWAVEIAFREGINTAMEELKFKELIASKAKEILSDNDFIKELAEKKVRASLGLTNI